MQAEQQIIYAVAPDDTAGRPPQRTKAESGTQNKGGMVLELHPDAEAWASIAELYSELGEADIRRVVVSEHLARYAQTLSAIGANQDVRPIQSLSGSGLRVPSMYVIDNIGMGILYLNTS